MILDTQSMLSGTIASDGTRSGQAITATAISTNVMDARALTGSPTLVDLGTVGADLYLVVQVSQAFNTLTSLTITLESDSTANLATAPTVHYSSGAIALAALTVNTTLLRLPLPVGATYKRYLGVRYTVTGTNPTLGTVYANLVMDHGLNTHYPIGYVI
jgi:hypothetical protein